MLNSMWRGNFTSGIGAVLLTFLIWACNKEDGIQTDQHKKYLAAQSETGEPTPAIFIQDTFLPVEKRWNEERFQSMSPAERYRYVHDYPYWKIKSGKEQSDLIVKMLVTAQLEGDSRTELAVKYYMSRVSVNPGFEMPHGKTGRQLFFEIEAEAREKGFEVEEVVAHHFIAGILRASNEITIQQHYVENQQTFERMKEIGFEKFRDYEVEGILFSIAYFMWELEDFEKSYQYLKVAEQFIQPDNWGAHYFTQVLSYLQTYWKQKKDFAKSIEYTQKILQFHENLPYRDPEFLWWNLFWRGFANIEMAALLIEQGNIAESESYADKGYELSKAKEPVTSMVPYHAEFDALMVLIPIKLKLGKMNEAGELLQRAVFIQEKLESIGELEYFKPLKLYRHFSTYQELEGNAATALRYTRLAQSLQDSFDRRNDAHKLAQAQQRHEAEKFAQKLQMVESEKILQKQLRNATLVILLLVIFLAYGNYHRLQIKRRQKEAELAAAKLELVHLTQGLREKSEMVDNLRFENEKLADQGRHSEYIEQLTSSTILTDEDWVRFRALFEKVYPGFIVEQKAQFPDLTPAEIRLLVMDQLGLNVQEMANMLGVNKNTIHQTRVRLRRRIGQ